MTRKKVKLAYITDVTARKATFKKRKKGIIKKVSELSILCGIQACAIITNPFDSKTEVWPDPEGTRHIIERYRSTFTLDESKNVNQESFNTQRVAKAQDYVKKQRQKNREKEMTLAMFQYLKSGILPQQVNYEDLKDLERLIEKNLKQIMNRIEALS
ncbi:hypothetical protein RJT34_23088 [Clitoria ternatea]|uniref:MADS-box domain-containing protein n=1 Tax=Clitoria ternatea TaxID=43366 RepID=A0AAN9II29_CLITE